MPFKPNIQQTFWIIFILTVVAMGYALYLQHFEYLNPCPLCIFQRVAVISVGAMAFIGGVHNPKGFGRRIYAGLALIAALIGAAIAGRHVWLQNLPPDKVPACGPGLDYWLDTFPLQEVIQKVFHGSGECATIDWSFLGITLPGMTLLLFIGLAVLAGWQLLRRS